MGENSSLKCHSCAASLKLNKFNENAKHITCEYCDVVNKVADDREALSESNTYKHAEMHIYEKPSVSIEDNMPRNMSLMKNGDGVVISYQKKVRNFVFKIIMVLCMFVAFAVAILQEASKVNEIVSVSIFFVIFACFAIRITWRFVYKAKNIRRLIVSDDCISIEDSMNKSIFRVFNRYRNIRVNHSSVKNIMVKKFHNRSFVVLQTFDDKEYPLFYHFLSEEEAVALADYVKSQIN